MDHTTMKDKKSQDLPSVSRRPKQANSTIQSKSESMRIRVGDRVNSSPSLEEDEMMWFLLRQ